ncbi:MAG: folate-binding protein [Pseudomonadota bacterium]
MAHSGFVDTGRAVLAMAGADARTVLQDVVTNNVERAVDGNAVYSALLTPQGKYLFDFFMVPSGSSPDAPLLIDVAADRAEALAARLRMYFIRRDAAIGVVKVEVAMIWGDGEPDIAGAIVVADPRDPSLGWRAYGQGMVLDGIAHGEREAYDALRISAQVPASGIELVPDDTYILEAGFERLDGVDFRKGCYVGQEVTARMKHKTTLRKGLVRVTVTGDAAPGTPIIANGKPVGTLFSASDGAGLAHLRFDRAGAGMQAGDAVVDFVPEADAD